MFSRDLIQPVQTLCELLDLIQAQPDQDRTAISFYRGAERGASLTYLPRRDEHRRDRGAAQP